MCFSFSLFSLCSASIILKNSFHKLFYWFPDWYNNIIIMGKIIEKRVSGIQKNLSLHSVLHCFVFFEQVKIWIKLGLRNIWVISCSSQINALVLCSLRWYVIIKIALLIFFSELKMLIEIIDVSIYYELTPGTLFYVTYDYLFVLRTIYPIFHIYLLRILLHELLFFQRK